MDQVGQLAMPVPFAQNNVKCQVVSSSAEVLLRQSLGREYIKSRYACEINALEILYI